MHRRSVTLIPETLVTERLVLEPLEVFHAAEIAVVLDDPELHRYTGGGPLSHDALTRQYERQTRGRPDDESERWFNWIVRDSSGTALGYVQATVEVASGTTDVAWVIGSSFQGRGYAREAATKMVSWLRANGITAVTAHINPDNSASAAIARAVGLAPTSVLVHGEVVWQINHLGSSHPRPRRTA
jgi:RimJ/RimL family protein N-acetyltransferase